MVKKTHLHGRIRRRCKFDPWVVKITLEDDMETQFSILA